MRLKYKKFILIFTVVIMFIGLGMFSLIAPSMDFSLGTSGAKSVTETVVENMTEAEVNKGIVDVITAYMDAKQKVDMDAIAKCVTDVSHVDEKRLVTDAEYVEEYRNIKCTIKESPNVGLYFVYVYFEMKVYNIDTLIPSLNALYVTVMEDGNFQVYFGDLDGDTQKAFSKVNESDEIKKLTDSVNKKLEELVSSNEDVRSFYEMLESSDDEEINDNIDDEAGSSKGKSAK